MINLTMSLSEESASSSPAGRPSRNLQLGWWSASHPLSPDVTVERPRSSTTPVKYHWCDCCHNKAELVRHNGEVSFSTKDCNHS